MQNLFEALKPEARKIIDDYSISYPVSAKSLVSELKSTSRLGDIKYEYILEMAGMPEFRSIMNLDFYNYGDSLMIHNLYKLFNR